MSNSSFGDYLRQLREKYNFSLRGLAIEIKMDSSLISKIERGERNPTREQIKFISEFFEINEQRLLMENLSDQIAYKIIEEKLDNEVLKLAEQKIKYLKKKK